MDANNSSDYELVVEFVNGRQSSIEVLIRRHQKRVYSYIFLLVKKQVVAEDIFQETFIRVIKSLKEGKYIDTNRFSSWAMRIAHNLIIDHFRREKQSKMLSKDAYEVDILNHPRYSDKTVEEEIVFEQILTDVRALIEQLPEDQREVILLRHYSDLSYKEIAEQTNVSINTALGRMRYAIINMRKIMVENKMILTS
ncbi:MAG: sigma-70 family RNA polymerase sigma factor [Bacteroidales bacterium]|nr:sigma-70 family RNA polymerase sigma factor [Bacteroidales bacterium]